MGELDDTNQRKRNGSRHQIVEIRGGLGFAKPTHDVKAIGVDLCCAVVAGENEELVSAGLDKFADKAVVERVDRAQLIKIFLNVALTTKDRVDRGPAVSDGTEKSRLMTLDRSIRSQTGSVVGSNNFFALLDSSRQSGSYGMNLICAKEAGFKIGEHERKSIVVLTRCLFDAEYN